MNRVGVSLWIRGSLTGALVLFTAFSTLVEAIRPARASGLTVDTQVTTHQSSASTGITSPALSTSGSNELLLAFITSDGPSSSRQSFSSVIGGGLTWSLRQRANSQAGTAEIWQAVASTPVSNAKVTATRTSGSYVGSITVTAFTGANTAVTAGASAGSGAPTATLTTTGSGSWIWTVGNDWDQALARVVGPNQTEADEYLATGSGDTFWVQRQTNPTPAAGTVVTMNDTSPTTDRWNLSIIEILPQ